MSSVSLSVLITYHNRPDTLNRLISQLADRRVDSMEIIVSDDCSEIPPSLPSDLPLNIKLVRTPERRGYSGNCLFALGHASGKYIIFMSDDDELADHSFLSKAVEKLDNGYDMVFARTETRCGSHINLSTHLFSPEYSSEQFLEKLKELNFSFLDYFSFSSCVFRRDIFSNIRPFESFFPNANSVDISNIIKYAMSCGKIAFLDMTGFIWNRASQDSISTVKKDDMTYQTMQSVSAAIDIYNYFDGSDSCVDTCNSYLEYIFNAILSDYYQIDRQKHFECLLRDLPDGSFYIYGMGWVGRELADYSKENGRQIAGFIDDFKADGQNVLSFNDFAALPCQKTVVIANYKYSHTFKIFKKLSSLDNTDIYDIISYYQS